MPPLHRHSPYNVVWELDAWDDLQQLEEEDSEVADAAITLVEDLASHRKRGKALGDRNISGDLTGLFRLKFDVGTHQPQRFRLVYRLEPNDFPDTIVVVIIGIRNEHEVYRKAIERLKENLQEEK